MATINDSFIQAQLSQAVYSEGFTDGMAGGGTESTPSDYARLLMIDGGAEMSLPQAITFANTYTVVEQYTSTTTGFSGTLFKDASGKKYLAIRGTEPTSPSDWIENVANIGSDGIAINQAIDMYNWFQRLKGDSGAEVTQYEYHKEETNWLGQITQDAWLESSAITATEDGGLVDAASNSLTVTGHSLGGHLATVMARIAPSLFSSAATFNAVGFDTSMAFDWHFHVPGPSLTALTSDGFFNLLREAEGIGITDIKSDWGSVWGSVELDRFRVPGDAVSLIGSVPGADDKQEIFSESADEGFIDSHSMKLVADSFAVYNVFAAIDENVSVETITTILNSIPVNDIVNTLEMTLASVGRIYDKTGYPITETNGDDFYKNLYELHEVLTVGTVSSLNGDSAETLKNMAETNEASLHAVINLNPFTITGVDYNHLNQNGELNPGNYSDNYLEDRALFLYNSMHSYSGQIYFHDVTTDFKLNFYDDELPYSEYIFGTEGDDTAKLIGTLSEDHLYGMAGNDTLNGNGGNDILEGGTGSDTMNGGAGEDTFIIHGIDEDPEAYDTFNGGTGNEDTILGGNLDDTIRVNSLSRAENSIEIINGGEGVNVISGTSGNNIVDLTGITVSNINRIEGGPEPTP